MKIYWDVLAGKNVEHISCLQKLNDMCMTVNDVKIEIIKHVNDISFVSTPCIIHLKFIIVHILLDKIGKTVFDIGNFGVFIHQKNLKIFYKKLNKHIDKIINEL